MKGRQGAGAGSMYVAGAFGISGLLTYVFHGLVGRYLGQVGYGDFGVLWTQVFLVAQVLWIGVSQTLGRYIAEREARGEDAAPVVSAVRRLTLVMVAAFVIVALPLSPLLAGTVFGGSYLLALAFVAAVVLYAPEYFRRGTFGGQRQFARLGALHVVESSSRMLVGAGLLFVGAGVVGAAAAVVLAPLLAVLVVRPPSPTPEDRPVETQVVEPFSAVRAFRFAGPVVACVALAQALMNGGPLLVRLLGGTSAEVGLFVAALILARTPQYVLSPVISSLLPHASRTLTTDGITGFDRFILRAVVAVGAMGVLMVAGTWLLGEWALGLVYGPEFDAGTGILTLLAALAAFYLLTETLSQALFALGRARLASLGWLLGLPVAAVVMLLSSAGTLERVSFSLALGAAAAALGQAAFYLLARRGLSGRDTG